MNIARNRGHVNRAHAKKRRLAKIVSLDDTRKRVQWFPAMSILLSDIDTFLKETGMGEYRFGLLAASNGRLVERLRAGSTPVKGKPTRVWPETEMQIRVFMQTERAKRGVAA